MAGIGHQPDWDTRRLAGESLAVQIPAVVITSRAGVESFIAIVGNRAVAALTTEMVSQCLA